MAAVIPSKEMKELDKYLSNKEKYDELFKILEENKNEKIYKDEKTFIEYMKSLVDLPKNIFEKVIIGLSLMDKTAEIHRDKNGDIIKDNTTKDTEIVKYTKDVDVYMAEEVLPHIPDAMYYFEEDK